MKRLLSAACLCAFAATPAVAADRGFYLGFDLGQASYDLDQRGYDQAVTGLIEGAGLTILDAASDTSEDGFTYGLILGYQIFNFLAVEAAYVDLGDAEYKARALVTDGEVDGTISGSITPESSGPTLSALGILPYGNWQAYLRAGVYFANNDIEATIGSGGVSDSVSDSDSSQEFLWGAGFGYSSGDWTLRLDYQMFMDVGDEETTGEADVSRIVLGAIYHF